MDKNAEGIGKIKLSIPRYRPSDAKGQVPKVSAPSSHKDMQADTATRMGTPRSHVESSASGSKSIISVEAQMYDRILRPSMASKSVGTAAKKGPSLADEIMKKYNGTKREILTAEPASPRNAEKDRESQVTLLQSMSSRLKVLEKESYELKKTAQRYKEAFEASEEHAKELKKQLEHSISESRLFREAMQLARSSDSPTPSNLTTEDLAANDTKAYGMHYREKSTHDDSPIATEASQDPLSISSAQTIAEKFVQRELSNKAVISHLDQKTKTQAQEIEALRKQVAEMEKFLGDYGLVWVGNAPSTTPSTNEIAYARQGKARYSNNYPSDDKDDASVSSETDIDFPLLFLRLRQLNALVNAGKSEVVVRNGVHKLEVRRGIPLAIFKDGFFMKRGPFRAWADSLPFLTDILEGYFPFELKELYPSGVPFELTDHSDVTYSEYCADNTQNSASNSKESADEAETGSAFVPFGGKGHSLANQSNNGNFATLESIGNGEFKSPFAPISQEQFLQRVPAKVVSSTGSVVSVREKLQKVLNPSHTSLPQLKVDLDPCSVGAMSLKDCLSKSSDPTQANTSAKSFLTMTESLVPETINGTINVDASHILPLSSAEGEIPARIATLQIRLDLPRVQGGTSTVSSATLVLKIPSHAPIDKVFDYVDKIRTLRQLAAESEAGASVINSSNSVPSDITKYELRTAAPPQAFPHPSLGAGPSLTLTEAKLVPSAVLFVRVI